MDNFVTDSFTGVRIYKDTNLIQIEIDKNKTKIHIKINDNTKNIDRNFINEFITPNFSVEMFYYVMYNFLKYNNFKLFYNDNNYTFEGYYTEHYEQSDVIHVKFDV
jgi:hypothetical protein